MKKSIFRFLLLLICVSVFSMEATAHPAWAIAVDEQNRIYLSDLEKIWKIDASGAVSIFAEKHTHELTLDAEGNLLGEELHYEPATQKFSSALWRITPGGEFAYTLAPTAQPPKGLSIWKNKDGATYYFGQTETEPREFYLLKRDAGGTVKVLFGEEKRALAQRQTVPYSFAGMAFGADGSLYFKSADAIWKAAPNDEISVVAGRREISTIAPKPMLFGLTIDAENNVYSADFSGKSVLKITADKKISAVYRAERDWSPTGVYARGGNLFILENKNLPPGAKPPVRVRKLQTDGKISTVATIDPAQRGISSNINSQSSPVSANQLNQPDRWSDKFCLGVGLMLAGGFFLGRKN